MILLPRFRQMALVLAILLSAGAAGAAEPAPLARIAFGSCAKQDRPQPIWDAIGELRPQVFLFLGDNIYADTEDMELMRRKYEQLASQPGYKQLKQNCQVLGTWDDHDYGMNDGGAEYPCKRESQQLFLDFFGVPKDSPRRKQEGVYYAERFGPEGQRVQIILLDSRYFRSPLTKGFEPSPSGEGYRGHYAPNRDSSASMLGEAQWKWLEEQLRLPAEVRVIGSSVQVIADEHGSESWGNFPLERQRLFDLIRRTRAGGVLFLSGDRHLAEMARFDAGLGYPLYDITSSSLNVPSGNFTKAGTRFANEINRHRVGLTYFETNFGLIDIDWTAADPLITAQVRDEQGGVVLQQRLRLSQLQPSAGSNPPPATSAGK